MHKEAAVWEGKPEANGQDQSVCQQNAPKTPGDQTVHSPLACLTLATMQSHQFQPPVSGKTRERERRLEKFRIFPKENAS